MRKIEVSASVNVSLLSFNLKVCDTKFYAVFFSTKKRGRQQF